MRCRAVFRLPVLLMLFVFVSCSGKADVWKSPADAEGYAKLEKATLDPRLAGSGRTAKERRARLFFLWGQELAAKAAQSPGETEARDGAIGAFLRVVDLDSVLVDESRFNLEILWRQKEKQEQQKKQNDENEENKSDSGDKKDKQDIKDKSREQDKQGDEQDQQGEQEKQGEQKKQGDLPGDQPGQQDKPKDLSALVRDKEQSSELDKALKMEMERLAERQDGQTGNALPVEKDW